MTTSQPTYWTHKAGYGGGLNKTLDKYANAPMLVIDEIDKVKNTEGRITWLNTILRRRYNEMLPVVLVGNIDLERLCQIIDLHGGEAMRDRIKELGIVVNFNFESYRPVLRGGEGLEH
ncbi:ATP-binding protein [Treponema phagedenis]|nr:ATP-binding protein [Treponema phagedenis]